MQDQQLGRDSKVLPRENRGMREWDQTDPPNKSLTGIFRRLLCLLQIGQGRQIPSGGCK